MGKKLLLNEVCIEYDMSLGGAPSNTPKTRLLYLLNSIPIVTRFFNKLLANSIGLPHSSQIGSGFKCSSPLITIGEHTSMSNTFVLAYAQVTIGNYCSFSFDNMIITSSHVFSNFDHVIAKPVTIGDNVWITSRVTILPGVTIGSNTIIGAGSVVTKDIPSGVFAAGNPCKVIKKINFSIERKNK